MPKDQVNKRVNLIFRSIGDKALKATVKSIRGVEKSTNRMAKSMRGLRRVFLLTFGALGIREVTRMADSIQLLSDRINIFTGDATEGAEALNLLFDAADLTNTSVDSLASTFNRVALATGDLGINTKELIGFVATLQNTFRLSGATVAESTGAAIQFSQGLASGAIRGQELRSVLEANVVIGDVFAKKFKIARGELIKFGETGKITAKAALEALAESAVDLNERASQLGQTFGQTLTKAMNTFKKQLNELNKKLKLNERFAESVKEIVSSLSDLSTEILKTGGLMDRVSPTVSKYFGLFSAGARHILGITNPVVELTRKIGEQGKLIRTIKNQLKEFENTGGKKFGFISNKENLFGIPEFVNLEKRKKKLELDLVVAEGLIKGFVANKNKILGLDKDGKSNKASEAIIDFSKGKFTGTVKKVEVTLKSLNNELKSSVINLDQYIEGVEKLKAANLNKQFKDGKISIFEFNVEMAKLGDKTEITFRRMKDGFALGTKAFVDSAKTFTTEFAGLVNTTFGSLETAIFDFTKGTEDAFAKMTQAILDDLLRILIRTQIVTPVAQGLLSGLGDSSGNPSSNTFVGPPAPNRKGNVLPFAQGGVVTRPTMFPLSTGTGLMAEAGTPEAVVPLSRTSDGDLGVAAIPNNTVININNSTDSQIDVNTTQDGSTQFIDIAVARSVKKAINSGALDRTLGASFGLNRKGSK